MFIILNKQHLTTMRNVVGCKGHWKNKQDQSKEADKSKKSQGLGETTEKY